MMVFDIIDAILTFLLTVFAIIAVCQTKKAMKQNKNIELFEKRYELYKKIINDKNVEKTRIKLLFNNYIFSLYSSWESKKNLFNNEKNNCIRRYSNLYFEEDGKKLFLTDEEIRNFKTSRNDEIKKLFENNIIYYEDNLFSYENYQTMNKKLYESENIVSKEKIKLNEEIEKFLHKSIVNF